MSKGGYSGREQTGFEHIQSLNMTDNEDHNNDDQGMKNQPAKLIELH